MGLWDGAAPLPWYNREFCIHVAPARHASNQSSKRTKHLATTRMFQHEWFYRYGGRLELLLPLLRQSCWPDALMRFAPVSATSHIKHILAYIIIVIRHE